MSPCPPDSDYIRIHRILFSCIILCLRIIRWLYPDWRKKFNSMKTSISLSTLPTKNKHHPIPVDTASGSLQTVQIKCSERVSISTNLAPILLDATLQRLESACAADPCFTWQARTASWILWNSNSLVIFLSKKFSLVSWFVTGSTKQNPNSGISAYT